MVMAFLYGVAATAAIVLILAAWLHRDGDYACQQATLEPPITEAELSGSRGEWTLWPTGLECRFVTDSGIETRRVGPDLSPVTAIGTLSALAAIGIHVSLGLTNPHRTKQRSSKED